MAIELISCAPGPPSASVGGQRVAEFAQADLGHVQVSIQDSIAASADHIAGYEGTFDCTLALARQAIRLGHPLMDNAVIHRRDIDRAGDIVELALGRSGRGLSRFYLLLYTTIGCITGICTLAARELRSLAE
jgi:hypothetical protein